MKYLMGKEICRDLDQSVRREWLETNGIGGFASSTIIGMNTRRYHGLLVPATNPPLGRIVAVSKLEETIHFQDASYEISCNQYPGTIHPQGYQYLEHFHLNPFPTFTYRLKDLLLQKQVFMVYGENSTVVTYGPVTESISLDVRPLIAYRDYHHIARQNAFINTEVQILKEQVQINPYPDLPPLHIAHDAVHFNSESDWYYNIEYPVEAYRGLDNQEDLFCPGTFKFDLEPGESAHLILSHTHQDIEQVEAISENEITRRARVSQSIRIDDPVFQTLVSAADDFVVKRKDGLSTVIAGYPWFSDWGRDTMIALPGLTLVTQRFDEARDILEAFAKSCDRGMIPNRFPDHGETADYNSVDATLWYFHAVDRYLAYTDDMEFVQETLWPVLTSIIDWFRKGTRFGIRLDDDGLLQAGEAGVQLTWMDAKVGDWVVMPRAGKPVEINALWYNALCVMKSLAEKLKDPDSTANYEAMAAETKSRFEAAFWNQDAGCLYDYIHEDYRDPAIRPNQVFALSLPYRMLDENRERQVLEVIEQKLLTPMGLRSLAPDDASYRGHYGGDQTSRDGAYHQGTVWSWLIGPFICARVRILGGTQKARQEALAMLQPLRQHLYDAGVGQVSEIFDGDSPHTPRGCFAQAWSVAEVLRAYVEDIVEEGER